jgi:hypothetical protein
MTTANRSPLSSLIERVLPRLKYPQLFAVLAGLLLVDLLVPDPIPFVDEAALALLTFLVGSWRTRREPRETADEDLPPKDVTARGSDEPAPPSPKPPPEP